MWNLLVYNKNSSYDRICIHDNLLAGVFYAVLGACTCCLEGLCLYVRLIYIYNNGRACLSACVCVCVSVRNVSDNFERSIFGSATRAWCRLCLPIRPKGITNCEWTIWYGKHLCAFECNGNWETNFIFYVVSICLYTCVCLCVCVCVCKLVRSLCERD